MELNIVLDMMSVVIFLVLLFDTNSKFYYLIRIILIGKSYIICFICRVGWLWCYIIMTLFFLVPWILLEVCMSSRKVDSGNIIFEKSGSILVTITQVLLVMIRVNISFSSFRWVSTLFIFSVVAELLSFWFGCLIYYYYFFMFRLFLYVEGHLWIFAENWHILYSVGSTSRYVF